MSSSRAPPAASAARLLRRFVEEGARAVVVADRDVQGAEAIAAELGPRALAVEFRRRRGEQRARADRDRLGGQRRDRHLHLERGRRRHGRRPRGERRGLGRSVARQRDGARVGLARTAARDARARRGLSDQHRLRRRPADAGLLADLQRHQARRRVAGGVDGDRISRPRRARLVHLPAGRAHADARTRNGGGRRRGRAVVGRPDRTRGGRRRCRRRHPPRSAS